MAERRWARITAAALVAVVGLLLLTGFSQSRQLRETEKKRDVEQARNTAHGAEQPEPELPHRLLPHSITAESKLPAFGVLPPVRAGNEKAMIGSAALKGYSVETFTPGVQGLLQMLVTVTGLSEPRLQSGTLDEIGVRPVTSFEPASVVPSSACCC